MKDQYFGDVGDYRKFSILRSLSSEKLKVLICWMYTPPDGRMDGRFIEYLSQAGLWRAYEPDIFDLLQNSVLKKKTRKLAIIEKSGVLPNTSFFTKTLGDELLVRDKFFTSLYTESITADLVFLDPDNGIEVKSMKMGKTNSNRYIYWKEIENLYSLGKSVMVYQHFGRQKRDGFISSLASQAKERLGLHQVMTLRTKNSFYLLAPQKKHLPKLAKGLSVISKKWGEYIRIQEH